MKRLSFKEWLYTCDEEGATGEQVVVSSFMIIPIFSLALASIYRGAIDFGILPIAFIVQFLYVLVYYLIDSRIR